LPDTEWIYSLLRTATWRMRLLEQQMQRPGRSRLGEVFPFFRNFIVGRRTGWRAIKLACPARRCSNFSTRRRRTNAILPTILANGEHAAQKFLFATLVKAGKTILFEPDGIVVKEDAASITIHGPNVDKF